MELEDMVNLILNTGVTAFIIVYFAYRDVKFISTLNSTLVSLVDTVQALKEAIERKKEGE